MSLIEEEVGGEAEADASLKEKNGCKYRESGMCKVATKEAYDNDYGFWVFWEALLAGGLDWSLVIGISRSVNPHWL